MSYEVEIGKLTIENQKLRELLSQIIKDNGEFVEFLKEENRTLSLRLDSASGKNMPKLKSFMEGIPPIRFPSPEVKLPLYDNVNQPKHYLQHPSGVECIQITEHMNFCTGNAIKYMWRADHKNGLEDLKKARWYVDREIQRREKERDGKA